MNIPYVFKYCKHCNRWLVASMVNFRKQKRSKYGLRSQCKKCDNKYSKKYREQNREYCKEYRKQYYEQNREYYKEYNNQYREQNQDYYKKYKKLWHEQNKERHNEYYKKYYKVNKNYFNNYYKEYRESIHGQTIFFNINHKRRLKEQNQGNGITKEQWLEMMTYFNWKCAYSGEYIGGNNNQNIRSIDHIIPLNKGGEHEIWNLVPMDKGFNSSKHDKDMLQWYKEQTFFSEERLNKIYEWQEYAYKKWHNKEEII